MDKVIQINVETNEITKRNLTKAELEQRKTDAELEEERLSNRANTRERAMAKLLALGLTEEEIAAL